MSASLCQVDTRQFSARIEELHDALIGKGRAGDAAMVFEDEARKFLTTVINVTPPRSRSQGEQAIKNDMYNIFTPIEEGLLNEIGEKFGVNSIDTWITDTSGSRQHLHWSRLDPTGAGMAAWHLENRDAHGRTRLRNPFKIGRHSEDWYSAYVVTKKDFDDYVVKVQKGVGLRKAAWGLALVKLKGKLAGWVFNQVATGNPKGEAQVKLEGDKPAISMRNFSPGILDDQRVVNYALAVRYRAIGARLKRLISDYAGDFRSGKAIAKRMRHEYWADVDK